MLMFFMRFLYLGKIMIPQILIVMKKEVLYQSDESDNNEKDVLPNYNPSREPKNSTLGQRRIDRLHIWESFQTDDEYNNLQELHDI
ncbi:7beta-hydroxysteroid dehydrogenase [Frankliniella fusca]|uniref:7beta-hydroxysteroid dehydrogenase n=1 Tax=Frankliniella fusca TaxID=407009 RepID=A0AAE1H848_9NEOP|nr:7beta-hydroxysteroid dehydrogenase [Frankliniella fusca]